MRLLSDLLPLDFPATNSFCSITTFVLPVLQKLQALSPDDCAVSSITAFELYTGTILSAQPERERGKVERFLDQLTVIAFDRLAAQRACIRAELQRAGSRIGAYDLLIAAEAMRSGFVLVSSNDREFARIVNLRVESWRK